MPRYFFHIDDAHGHPDAEGTELPDLVTAKREAVKLAGATVIEEADRLVSSGDWSMRVSDAVGVTLFRLRLSALGQSSLG